MKFQKKLSKERLSLLSAEDRALYETEQKQLAEQEFNTIFGTQEDIFSQDDILNENYEERVSKEKEELMEMVNDYYYSELRHMISESDFVELRDEFLSQLIDENEVKFTSDMLKESAEGLDSGAWISGLGLKGIGAKAALLLGALASALVWTAGVIYDRLRMAALRKYMIKMVMICDSGEKKREEWFRPFLFSKQKKYGGEYNNACFRFIQEMSSRNMVLSVMNAAQQLGYFKPNMMTKIGSSAPPQQGGGLSDFKDNVIEKLQLVN